jgi:hypothetical protein
MHSARLATIVRIAAPEVALPPPVERWDSGCIQIDKRATIFFSQLSISVLVMGFSIYQLCTLNECAPQQAYIGLLTLCLGVWLPQPSITKAPLVA